MKKLLLIVLTFFLLGCTSSSLNSEEEIADLKTLPQDALAYLKQGQFFINPKFVELLQQGFLKKQFEVWANFNLAINQDKLLLWHEGFLKKTYYGENRKKIPLTTVKELLENAHIVNYPSFKRPALTIKNTSLRILPTSKPFFNDFKRAGQGYPFDMLQVSAVWANTPLMVLHYSLDFAWAYVQTPFAAGWMPTTDFAWINQGQKDAFIHGDMVFVNKDNIAVRWQNQFLFYAHLGTSFLLKKETLNGFFVFVPTQDKEKNLVFKEFYLSNKEGIKGFLPPNSRNIALSINQLLGQNYGWGGLFENRDCSAALKDLFSLFALWIPRNSYYQSRQGGIYYSLASLSNPEKEQFILKNGVPFLTLVWLPGHIMLYLGTDSRGRAVVFHNTWGLRIIDSNNKEGRKIIGKAVITTLEPGKELKELKSPLISRIKGITFLIPPPFVQQFILQAGNIIKSPF